MTKIMEPKISDLGQVKQSLKTALHSTPFPFRARPRREDPIFA